MKEVYKSIIELQRQVFTKIARLAYNGNYDRIKI
ncbi:hypothetical protein U732_3665 [Clostridium argentinense CDC 2741]|uniref:Uncharacterized protein n=1 Tax=Clostridium argentinense CDC 2741 TaxID=1418104 RepID=A0A0C1U4Y8_9CLOT|nr:hypothetical protein U732_3665 [Clostridium argentinense CDC 2741]